MTWISLEWRPFSPRNKNLVPLPSFHWGRPLRLCCGAFFCNSVAEGRKFNKKHVIPQLLAIAMMVIFPAWHRFTGPTLASGCEIKFENGPIKRMHTKSRRQRRRRRAICQWERLFTTQGQAASAAPGLWNFSTVLQDNKEKNWKIAGRVPAEF